MTSLLQGQSMGVLLGRTGQFCHLHSTGSSRLTEPLLIRHMQWHAENECVALILLGLMQSMHTSAPLI